MCCHWLLVVEDNCKFRTQNFLKKIMESDITDSIKKMESDITGI